MSYHDFVLEEMEKLKELESAEAKAQDSVNSLDYWHRERTIQFNLTSITIIPIQARYDYSNEESSRIWYQESDLLEISSWNRMTLKLLKQQGDLSNEPEHCIRGLESKIKDDANDRRKELRTIAKYAVFDEQSKQRNQLYRFKNDPLAIRLAYQQYTLPCQLEAQERGSRDEKANKEEVKRVPNERSSKLITGFDDSDLHTLKEFDYQEQEILDQSCQARISEREEPKNSEGRQFNKWRKKGLLQYMKEKMKKSSPTQILRKAHKKSTSVDNNLVNDAIAPNMSYGYNTHKSTTDTEGSVKRRMRRRSSM